MKISINRNLLWSDVFVKQLEKCGLKNICISPGSRSTSLVIAFSKSKRIKTHVIVDERSSSYFALGLAKASKTPTLILTTSGTAVANLYPAIIEAYNSRVPLIVLTADRPEYLINTGANQTINQINIFKNHIRKYYNPGLPKLTISSFINLKKIAVDAFLTSSKSDIGPVHINLPFDKPFEPSVKTSAVDDLKIQKFYSLLEIKDKIIKSNQINIILPKTSRGLILLGGKDYDQKFLKKLINFSHASKFPILSEGNASLRFVNINSQNVISNHTSFLRSAKIAKFLDPEVILQFGSAPVSNVILEYFKNSKAEKFLVNSSGDIHDPSRSYNKLITIDELTFINKAIESVSSKSDSSFLNKFVELDKICNQVKSSCFSKQSIKIESRLIESIIPLLENDANLFLSNSMPIRDFDYFSSVSKKNIKIYSNRGASGIDGIISTAAGVASQSASPTYLIIGDLAFHHDINGLQALAKYNIPLKIILINNCGGRIFNVLPISKEQIEFDKYFRTELNLNFKLMVRASKGIYNSVTSLKQLRSFIINKTNTFSVAEIRTNTEKSIKFRNEYWGKVTTECENYLFQ